MQNAARLRLFGTAAAQLLKDGRPYAPGDTLVQPELAATLRRLMRDPGDRARRGWADQPERLHDTRDRRRGRPSDPGRRRRRRLPNQRWRRSSNRVDFGLTLPVTVDAERFDTQGTSTSTLSIEDARVEPAALASLQARGWTLERLGEYGARPRMQVAGVEPRSACRPPPPVSP